MYYWFSILSAYRMALIVWFSNKLIFNEIVFFIYALRIYDIPDRTTISIVPTFTTNTYTYQKHAMESQQVSNNQGERKYYEQHNLKQNLAESLRWMKPSSQKAEIFFANGWPYRNLGGSIIAFQRRIISNFVWILGLWKFSNWLNRLFQGANSFAGIYLPWRKI